MIRITLERKALNSNATPKMKINCTFEFHFKSLLQKELSQLCLALCPIGLCFLIPLCPDVSPIDHLLHSFPRIHIASLNRILTLRVSGFTRDKLQLCQHALSSQIH
ncbi:hypothetical protein T12_8226 [Trichinella patagoniensis]|uniref:Uncharacterized protein n=1 Tax=Trichinella patagoniensis TaxID=990121 RepID=A0A0V0ZBK5_9BILA|nr:hypothetical protein T12_8226 [Trichinella patagoniensis]